VSCAGRFYGVTFDAIMMVDMTGGPLWLVVAAKMDKQMCYGSMTGGTVHLVDNGGELVLVHCTYHTIRDYDVGVIHETMYKVYRIDLDRGRMVPTTNLHGCAIFIDKDYKTLSVVPQVSPSSMPTPFTLPLAWVVGMVPIIVEEDTDQVTPRQ
jgi:hypothetical protein